MAYSIFLSHSSSDGNGAGLLRSALTSALGNGPGGRGYQVHLDETELKPGDRWRPKLYRWLGDCAGAVLFLGPAALDSPWVRKEATILSWRRALLAQLGSDLTIVPLLVDGVTPGEVAKAFPAVYLDESQFLPATVDSLEDAAAVAAKVAARFPGLPSSRDDALREWTSRVGAWLHSVDAHSLAQAADCLGLAEEWSVDTGASQQARCLTLADVLLHSEFEQVTPALSEIIAGGAEVTRRLIGSLVLTSVPAESAPAVVAAMLEQSDHLLGITAKYTETAERFVRRAVCDRRVLTVPPPPPVLTEESDALYDDLVAAIARRTGYRPDDFAPEDLEDVGEPLVVFLRAKDAGDGLDLAVLRAVLARLRSEFPSVVVVVLSGPQVLPAEVLGVPALRYVEPTLDSGRERQVSAAVNRLLAEVVDMREDTRWAR